MINSGIKKISVWVVAVAVLAIVVYGFLTKERSSPFLEYTPLPSESVSGGEPSIASPEDVAEISRYSYTENYSNPRYGFALKYPAGFEVAEFPNDSGGEVVIIQNSQTQVGIQIAIAPNQGEDVDITEALVRMNIPDMKISNPQEVALSGGRKGLAFISDNEAFGGASREVWFVFRGNLYQISTYAEFDGFLRGVFNNWKFN